MGQTTGKMTVRKADKVSRENAVIANKFLLTTIISYHNSVTEYGSVLNSPVLATTK